MCLPNCWVTWGQYVWGHFVQLHQVVAESIRLLVIKQRLKILKEALNVKKLMEAVRLASVDAFILWWVVSRNFHNILLCKSSLLFSNYVGRNQTTTKWIRIKIMLTIEYWAHFLTGLFIAVRFGRCAFCIGDRCICGSATVRFPCRAWTILQTPLPH